MTRSATASSAPALCWREKPASAMQPSRRTTSTAKDGLTVCRSFGFLLLPGLQPAEGLFQFPNVVRREFAGIGKLRHHRRGSATEEAQNFVEHAIARHIPGDQRLEDIGVADFFRSAQCALGFHAVDDRLDCRVRGARFGEESMDLANRRFSASPERFQNAKFEFAEFWLRHPSTTL